VNFQQDEENWKTLQAIWCLESEPGITFAADFLEEKAKERVSLFG
jgi:hypothetical protein